MCLNVCTWMCVSLLSSVASIAFTVLLGTMYLLLVWCTVPTLLCLHLTPAFSPCSYRKPFTIAAHSHLNILAPETNDLKCSLLLFCNAESEDRKCKTTKGILATYSSMIWRSILFLWNSMMSRFPDTFVFLYGLKSPC